MNDINAFTKHYKKQKKNSNNTNNNNNNCYLVVDGEVSYMCPRFSVHLLQCVSVFVPVDVVSPTVGLLGKGAGTTKKGGNREHITW